LVFVLHIEEELGRQWVVALSSYMQFPEVELQGSTFYFTPGKPIPLDRKKVLGLN
jgi:hypothetical protein